MPSFTFTGLMPSFTLMWLTPSFILTWLVPSFPLTWLTPTTNISQLTAGPGQVAADARRCQLTGVQALGDGGGFDQVAAAQVAGDEVVEVSHQVLPARRRHT